MTGRGLKPFIYFQDEQNMTGKISSFPSTVDSATSPDQSTLSTRAPTLATQTTMATALSGGSGQDTPSRRSFLRLPPRQSLDKFTANFLRRGDSDPGKTARPDKSPGKPSAPAAGKRPVTWLVKRNDYKKVDISQIRRTGDTADRAEFRPLVLLGLPVPEIEAVLTRAFDELDRLDREHRRTVERDAPASQKPVLNEMLERQYAQTRKAVEESRNSAYQSSKYNSALSLAEVASLVPSIRLAHDAGEIAVSEVEELQLVQAEKCLRHLEAAQADLDRLTKKSNRPSWLSPNLSGRRQGSLSGDAIERATIQCDVREADLRLAVHVVSLANGLAVGNKASSDTLQAYDEKVRKRLDRALTQESEAPADVAQAAPVDLLVDIPLSSAAEWAELQDRFDKWK
jgi:hypothetical protein